MAQLTGNWRGIAAMSAAMLALTSNFALIKLAGDTVPVGQALFIRATTGVALITVVVLWTGAYRHITRVFNRMVMARTLFETISAVLFFLALLQMPVANATVVLQALPLVVTAAAALFLGEVVRPSRWAAIVVGFLGVLLVIRPGYSAYDAATFLVVGAVILSAMRDLATRLMPVTVPTLLVAGVALLAQSLVGLGIGITEDWAWPETRALAYLAGAAVLLVLGLFCLIHAMRGGEVSIISPFRYTSIVFAITIDFVVWGKLVDAYMLAGATIIIASGIYLSTRGRTRVEAPASAVER
jgi:drug/metabolite transporter (DMT)-like permease